MTLLDRVIIMCSNNDNRTAVGTLMEEIDELLIANNMPECQNFIINATKEIEKLSPEVIMAILSITYAARKHLKKSRDLFYSEVLMNFNKRFDIAKVKRLLNHLK